MEYKIISVNIITDIIMIITIFLDNQIYKFKVSFDNVNEKLTRIQKQSLFCIIP